MAARRHTGIWVPVVPTSGPLLTLRRPNLHRYPRVAVISPRVQFAGSSDYELQT